MPYWVYPRVCGGTHKQSPLPHQGSGLSPRVRGNLAHPDRIIKIPRSIPACAGEPQWRKWRKSRKTVYPRVCGGTCLTLTISPVRPGLSPRVRGNRGGKGHGDDPLGSIPACAGEPRPFPMSRLRSPVYPRVCGGTNDVEPDLFFVVGLSPRVRGNRLEDAKQVQAEGSIPACAGEPCASGRAPRLPRVYPRVCGGTQSRASHSPGSNGLSPRVRGNPLQPLCLPPIP